MSKRKLIEGYDSEWSDTTKWHQVNLMQLNEKDKIVFLKRKEAIDYYFDSKMKLKEIEEKTGVAKKELNEFVKRCLQLDERGELYGYRGIIPRKTLKEYERKELPTDDNPEKMSGAFELFLNSHPEIKEFIQDRYLKRIKTVGDNVIRIKDLHKEFVDRCKKEGVTLSQYPLNTGDRGRRSLERYAKKMEDKYYTEAAARYGDDSSMLARTTGMGEKYIPAVSRPFQRVQFDGHKLDLLITVSFINSAGKEEIEIMDRVWLLVIIDEATRLVLGYHLCLRKEYSAADVLHCIKNSVIPKESYASIKGFKYSQEAGFHSIKFEECQWAVWDELLFDNAKANLANNVKDRLVNIMNCRVNAGPVGMPQRRAIIERFFGVLEDNNYHRYPNTTGSNPNDPKRKKNAKEEAIKFRMTEKELEELTELAIAEYNATPHTSLNYISPLDALKQHLTKGVPIRYLAENKRKESTFFQIEVKRNILGNKGNGKRPYINYEGAVYRSDVLSQSYGLVGEKLTLLVNIDDLRVVRAFLEDGTELGLLYVTGKWRERKHTLRDRKEISRLKNKKLIHYTDRDDPIKVYHEYLEKNAKVNKKARNELAVQKRAARKEPQKIEQTNAAEHSEILSTSPQRNPQDEKREPVVRKFKQTLIY